MLYTAECVRTNQAIFILQNILIYIQMYTKKKEPPIGTSHILFPADVMPVLL